jgi:hypothetical protein
MSSKTEMVNTFYIQLIGYFGLLYLNPSSTQINNFFWKQNVFRLDMIKSSDPEIIQVIDKLYKLGFLRSWTVSKIFSLFQEIKFKKKQRIDEKELLFILKEVNYNLIWCSIQFRGIVTDFISGRKKYDKIVKELYNKSLMYNKQKEFTKIAHSLLLKK